MTAQFLQTHFAVAVCAISGGLAGSGKRVDLFGDSTALGLRLILMRWKVSLPEFPK